MNKFILTPLLVIALVIIVWFGYLSMSHNNYKPVSETTTQSQPPKPTKPTYPRNALPSYY